MTPLSWRNLRVVLLLSVICLSGFQCWKTVNVSFVESPGYVDPLSFFQRVKRTVAASGFQQTEEFDRADAIVSIFTPIKVVPDIKGDDGGVTVSYDKNSRETTVRFSQMRPFTAAGKKRYRSLVAALKQTFGEGVVRAEEVD